MTTINIHQLQPTQSPLLTRASRGQICHGFTSKPFTVGGEITEENSQDQINANRKLLQDYLQSFSPEPIAPLAIPKQVHGTRIAHADDAHFDGTDAILVLKPFLPALVLMADCVPIILYDPTRHVGAVVHAGWRGTVQQIVKLSVKALQEEAGVKPQNLIAVIGPSISKSAFQVEKDIAQQLADSAQLRFETYVDMFYADPDGDELGKYWVNLKCTNAEQLRLVGVKDIDIIPQCTVQNHSKFYSFRAGDTGRQCGFLMLL